MKKLMFLLMMMVATVAASSQGLGDSYSSFINSDKEYKKNLDIGGDGYLLYMYSDAGMKFYFKDKVCNCIQLVTEHKYVADNFFDILAQNVDDSYKNENKITVYLNNTKGVYFTYTNKKINGTRFYYVDVCVQ